MLTILASLCLLAPQGRLDAPVVVNEICALATCGKTANTAGEKMSFIPLRQGMDVFIASVLMCRIFLPLK